MGQARGTNHQANGVEESVQITATGWCGRVLTKPEVGHHLVQGRQHGLTIGHHVRTQAQLRQRIARQVQGNEDPRIRRVDG